MLVWPLFYIYGGFTTIPRFHYLGIYCRVLEIIFIRHCQALLYFILFHMVGAPSTAKLPISLALYYTLLQASLILLLLSSFTHTSYRINLKRPRSTFSKAFHIHWYTQFRVVFINKATYYFLIGFLCAFRVAFAFDTKLPRRQWLCCTLLIIDFRHHQRSLLRARRDYHTRIIRFQLLSVICHVTADCFHFRIWAQDITQHDALRLIIFILITAIFLLADDIYEPVPATSRRLKCATRHFTRSF